MILISEYEIVNKGDIIMSIWTKKDVADHLRVSEVTINRWMKDRGLPFSKIGGSVRFVDKQINEWIKTKQQIRKD